MLQPPMKKIGANLFLKWVKGWGRGKPPAPVERVCEIYSCF